MGIEVDKSKLIQIVPGVWQKNEKTYYIVCSVLGTFHYCIKDRLDKLVAKQGSLEAVGANYISRDAKQSKKPEPSDETAINISAEEAKRIMLDSPPKFVLHSGGDIRVGKLLSDDWTKCMRPLLFQDNANFCNGCRWFNICRTKFKSWKVYKEQTRKVQAKFTDCEIYTESESIQNMSK